MEPNEDMTPGKYILYRQRHFVGFEIWTDGTCILRPTCRAHVGHVRPWHASLLENYDVIFKLEDRVECRCRGQEDLQGGAPLSQGMVLFQSPLSGRCFASSLALNFEEDKSFTAVARGVCSKALLQPPLAMSFVVGTWCVPDTVTWSDMGKPVEVDVVLHGRSTSGNRKMLRAIKEDDGQNVRALLSKGHDPDTRYPNGFTSLSYSVHADALHVLPVLLEGGANPDVYGLDGKLPLHQAVEKDNPAAVTCLLQHGADPNLADADGKTAALLAATQHGRNGIQILRLLRQAGADVNVADSFGYTPFGCCSNVNMLQYVMDFVWPQLCWQSVLIRNYREICQYGWPAGMAGVCKLVSKQCGRDFRSADVSGGSEQEVPIFGGHRVALCLLDVWGLLWSVAFWDMLPLAAFCEVKAANSCLYARMAALRERWESVKRSLVEGVVGQLIAEGVRMPHFQRPVVPHIQWDLYGCRRLERQYMRRLSAMVLPKTIAEGWSRLNPEHREGCQFLAQYAVKCRQALEIDGDGIGVYAAGSWWCNYN